MPYKDKQKQKEAQHRSYLRHREKIKRDKLTPEAKEARREWAVQSYQRKAERCHEIKEENPCVDCGKEYPYYVMDFDHVRGEKVASVSALLSNGFSWKVIEEEIAKCDIVCANCHRIRTHAKVAVPVRG